jgi:hypothetical protein
MQDAVKIGTAAVGGYLLGRTKKAKTAIALALWLSGKGRPADYARDQAVKLLSTGKAQDLIGQLRGPLLTAGRKAALSAFEGQAGRLTDGLTRRTEMLTGTSGDAGEQLGEAGRRTAKRLTSRRRRAAGLDEGDRARVQDEYDEDLEDEYVDDEEESLEQSTDDADDYEDDDYEDEDELGEDEEPEDDLEYSDYDDEPPNEDEEPRPARGRRRSARAVRETA